MSPRPNNGDYSNLFIVHLCRAMDASVARAASKLTNPVAADEASLVAGARLYRDHCTLCHGDPAHPKSPLADSLNPPPPQFMDYMADMPENQNFYILEHGIGWTAMPGWKRLHCAAYLADGDISQPHERPSSRRQASFQGNRASHLAAPRLSLNLG